MPRPNFGILKNKSGQTGSGNIFVSKPSGIKKHLTFDDVDTMTLMIDPLQSNAKENQGFSCIKVPTLNDLLNDYLAFEQKYQDNQESSDSTIIQKSKININSSPFYNESAFFKNNNKARFGDENYNEKKTSDKSFNELKTFDFNEILSENQQINLDIDDGDMDKTLFQSRFVQNANENKQNNFVGKQNKETLKQDTINTLFISDNINKYNQLNLDDELPLKNNSKAGSPKQNLSIFEENNENYEILKSIAKEVCINDVSIVSNKIYEIMDSYNFDSTDMLKQDLYKTSYFEESINVLFSLISESQKISYNKFQKAFDNLLNIHKKASFYLNKPKGTVDDIYKALNVIQKQNFINNNDESFHYLVLCNYLPFKVMKLQTNSQIKIKILSRYKQISNPQLPKNDFSPLFSHIAIHSRNKKYQEEMTNLMKRLPYFIYDHKNVSFIVSSDKIRIALVFKIPNHYPWCKLALPLIRVDFGISYQEIEKIIANILNSLKFNSSLLTKFIDELLSTLPK